MIYNWIYLILLSPPSVTHMSVWCIDIICTWTFFVNQVGSDNFVSKHQLLLTTFIIYLWYAEPVRHFILKPVLLKTLCLKTCSLIFAIKWFYFECLVKQIPSIGTIWGRLRASALERKRAFSFPKLVCARALELCRIQNHGEGQTKPHDCAIQHWIRFAGIVVHDFNNTKFMGLI